MRKVIDEDETVRIADAVLLQGFLSKKKLGRALGEIRSISLETGDCPMIIIASDGGDGVSAVNFVHAVKRWQDGFLVKIYEASSTAAYVALALSARSEMNKNATLSIHRGEIHLSPSQISPEGVVDKKLADSFRIYDVALVETLKKTGLNKDKKLMSELYATDWLRIPAEECLRRGIVQRLF